VELEGRPVRVAVTIDAALAADLELSRGAELDPSFPGIRLGVVVEDADGRLYGAPGGSATLVGDGQRIVAGIVGSDIDIDDPAGGGPAYPLRLVAVELGVSPNFSVAVGTIEVMSVESSEAPEGGAWDPVALDAGAPGWRWERTDSATSLSLTPPSGRPAAILLQRGGRANGPVYENFGGAPTTFRLSAPDHVDALAAIVSPAFLEAGGLAVGDTVTATSLGRAVPLRIIGSVALVPPLDPDAPFAVVDRQTLERATFDADAIVLRPAEWWLAVEPGTEAGVVAALRGEPFSAHEVVGRADLTATLSSDPIGLGVIGALGIGTAAALVFAAIGFLVSAASSANERFGEFALLRALGLSGRELGTWLSLENAFLLGIGLLAGSGLGLVLAWVVLPVSTLTDTGAPTVPPAAVVVPWPSLAPIWLLAIALLVVSVIVVGRTIRAVRISSVLRARDG
jgi:hypothetical protein